MTDQNILYDIPSKDPRRCWSLNPFKTRMILNYKKIPYQTQWVEYPDLEPTLRALGIPPNAEGAAYTSPAMRFNGEYMMDSKPIAEAIEAAHAEPSLHLDSPYLERLQEILPKITGPLMPVWLPRVPRNLLAPPSAEFFERTRSQRFGMSTVEMEKQKGGQTDGPWNEAEAGIRELAAMYKENGEGPFVMGKTLSYTDIVVVTAIHFFKRIDESVYERFVGYDKVLADLYSASTQWLARDDH